MASPKANHINVLTGVVQRLVLSSHWSEDDKRLIAEALLDSGHEADIDDEALHAAAAAVLDKRASDPTVTGVLAPAPVPGQIQSAEAVAANARMDRLEAMLTTLVESLTPNSVPEPEPVPEPVPAVLATAEADTEPY